MLKSASGAFRGGDLWKVLHVAQCEVSSGCERAAQGANKKARLGELALNPGQLTPTLTQLDDASPLRTFASSPHLTSPLKCHS